MQQNICSPAKDIKAFTLTESKAYGEKKSAKCRTKRVPNALESSMVVNILWQKFFRIPVLRKTKFEKLT